MSQTDMAFHISMAIKRDAELDTLAVIEGAQLIYNQQLKASENKDPSSAGTASCMLLQMHHACSCKCLRHVTNLRPNALPLYATVPLQVFLQCSQAPFRTHPITVSIFVGNKAWLVLVDAVVGHMHAPPPAQQVSGPPQGFHQMDRHDRCMQCWRITASAVSPPV